MIPDSVLLSRQGWEPGGRVTDLATGDDSAPEVVQRVADMLRQELKATSAALLEAREAMRGVVRRYREGPDYARTWLRGSCPFLDAVRRCLPESE